MSRSKWLGPKMKQTIKAQWVAALRSGAYQQTRRVLTDGRGFCCLGVLCNLHALATGRTWTQYPDGPHYLGAISVLPEEVAKWAGLDWVNPAVRLPDRPLASTLGRCNDTLRLDFAQIADAIEASL